MEERCLWVRNVRGVLSFGDYVVRTILMWIPHKKEELQRHALNLHLTHLSIVQDFIQSKPTDDIHYPLFKELAFHESIQGMNSRRPY
jgi:hypothetical protein